MPKLLPPLYWVVVVCLLCWAPNVLQAQVIANDDIASFYQNRSFDVSVLENDFGLVSGVKSLTISSLPRYGTCKVVSNQTIVYTPNYNYVGLDQFEYRVCANSGECDVATVFVDVLDFDYKPSLVNDTIVVINGLDDLVFDILDNDKAIYDEPISVLLIGKLVGGSIKLNTDYTISPSFKQYFHGLDSIKYAVCDANGDCDTALVVFEVRSKYDQDKMFIPNGISPNGDGRNDNFFIPDLENYVKLDISVFTQWGQLVYVDQNYDNNWDGRSNTGSYKGQLLPTGTYYYVITIKGSDIKIAGFIYLSR